MAKDMRCLSVNVNTGVVYHSHKWQCLFGARVFVDFVNRWCVLQQPAGRRTIKGVYRVNYSAPSWKIIHIQNQELIVTKLNIARKSQNVFYKSSGDVRQDMKLRCCILYSAKCSYRNNLISNISMNACVELLLTHCFSFTPWTSTTHFRPSTHQAVLH